MVHGLPPPNDIYGTGYGRRMMPSSSVDTYQDYTPEQFDRLPEYQQRIILRERYLKRQFDEHVRLTQPLLNLQRRDGVVESLSYWFVRNVDRLGWKSMLGIAVFLGGLYKAVSK